MNKYISIFKNQYDEEDVFKYQRSYNNNARINLTMSGYILYMYFLSHDSSVDIKPKIIIADTNLPRPTYYTAFAELVSKGYIVFTDNKCTFYEKPRPPGLPIDSKIKSMSIVKEKENAIFGLCSKTVNAHAMRNLSKAAYCLYTYFTANADGYVLQLHLLTIKRYVGLCKTTYYAALQELIDKGYVVSVADGYEFYENPDDSL